MKKILVICCALFLSACGEVQVLDSNGSTEICRCSAAATTFSECLVKACPNGVDVVVGSGNTDSTYPIFKCKPIPKPCPEIK